MANVFVRVWDAIRDQPKGKPTEDPIEELTEAQEKARDLGRIGRVVGGVIVVGVFALVLWSAALARKDTPFSANVFGLGLFLPWGGSSGRWRTRAFVWNSKVSERPRGGRAAAQSHCNR
jgi:hypothetical protein